MKLAKRILTAGAALALTLSLSLPAFAATITVSNPAAGEPYTAYKLFDVESNENQTAYSYSTTSAALVSALETASDNDENGFDVSFAKAANANVWYVSGLDDAEADDLAKYIHDNWANTFQALLTNSYSSTVDSSTGDVIISTGDITGYFYVTSSLGSLCALNTAETEADIFEKNTIPSITKAVKEDSTNEYVETATIDVIDTVSYQLTVNTGNNANNAGTATGVDADFVIADFLPTGITYKANSIKVMVGETEWELSTDYTVSYDADNNSLMIILLSTGKLKDQVEKTNIIITYDATVDGNVITHGNGNENANLVTLSYSNQTSQDYAYVNTFDIGGTAEDSTITKVEAGTNVPLKNVKFILSKGTGEATRYAQFDSSNYLSRWVTSQDDATELITDEEGHIYAYGLDADTYVLTETETLPGYNLLDDTITVVIAENGTVTYQPTSEVDDDDDSTNPEGSITIENNAGSELPSTGGMGTTVLYIAGIVLVLGAGITLVVRRRMNSDQ